VVGTVGQFDVEVDGKLVFSKAKTGRFPEGDEVIDRIPQDMLKDRNP
jgi:selT/selW/selH-like putative selenoprotein